MYITDLISIECPQHFVPNAFRVSQIVQDLLSGWKGKSGPYTPPFQIVNIASFISDTCSYQQMTSDQYFLVLTVTLCHSKVCILSLKFQR